MLDADLARLYGVTTSLSRRLHVPGRKAIRNFWDHNLQSCAHSSDLGGNAFDPRRFAPQKWMRSNGARTRDFKRFFETIQQRVETSIGRKKDWISSQNRVVGKVAESPSEQT